MKDLIIGGASNYSWKQLSGWVNSLRQVNFSGDVVLVVTNISNQTIEELTNMGVRLFIYGEKQNDGSYINKQKGPAHVERFFYIWHFLNTIKEKYRFVITTDTRDVVFQKNPSIWLENNLLNTPYKIVCSSEGLKYKDEPWGSNNLKEAFGQYMYDELKENLIYNVGTIAGEHEYIKDLLLMIFQMSINRPIPIVDQAVFNFIINQQPYKNVILKTSNIDKWAIQLGTTMGAIKSGKGDLGILCSQNPTELISYQLKYVDQQPNIDNLDFVIIHQYDRVNGLKEKIEQQFNID